MKDRATRLKLFIPAALMLVIGAWLIVDNKVANRHWIHVWNKISPQEHPYSELIPAAPQGFPVAMPGLILLDGEPAANLVTAFRTAKEGSFIQIGAGQYKEAAILKANNVKVIAEKGAVIYGKSVKGKGALLIQGDNTYIEGVECHSVTVADNNGVCVRLEGDGLILNNVYFHDAQGGLLAMPNKGEILIENSRFENLGGDPYAHDIYVTGYRLTIHNSVFLNHHGGGHEIKSRAQHTEITNSIVAAAQSRDSRLVDVPNGGELIFRNNVFVEGVFSENADLFSWGVEAAKHRGNIIIEDNIIISDKSLANLISIKSRPESKRVENNIVIGRVIGIDSDTNIVFPNREESGIEPAPFIPRLDEFMQQAGWAEPML